MCEQIGCKHTLFPPPPGTRGIISYVDVSEVETEKDEGIIDVYESAVLGFQRNIDGELYPVFGYSNCVSEDFSSRSQYRNEDGLNCSSLDKKVCTYRYALTVYSFEDYNKRFDEVKEQARSTHDRLRKQRLARKLTEVKP